MCLNINIWLLDMYFYVFYINIIPLQTSTVLGIKKAPLWAPIQKNKATPN